MSGTIGDSPREVSVPQEGMQEVTPKDKETEKKEPPTEPGLKNDKITREQALQALGIPPNAQGNLRIQVSYEPTPGEVSPLSPPNNVSVNSVVGAQTIMDAKIPMNDIETVQAFINGDQNAFLMLFDKEKSENIVVGNKAQFEGLMGMDVDVQKMDPAAAKLLARIKELAADQSNHILGHQQTNNVYAHNPQAQGNQIASLPSSIVSLMPKNQQQSYNTTVQNVQSKSINYSGISNQASNLYAGYLSTTIPGFAEKTTSTESSDHPTAGKIVRDESKDGEKSSDRTSKYEPEGSRAKVSADLDLNVNTSSKSSSEKADEQYVKKQDQLLQERKINYIRLEKESQIHGK